MTDLIFHDNNVVKLGKEPLILGDDDPGFFPQQSWIANDLIKDAYPETRINGGHGIVQQVDA